MLNPVIEEDMQLINNVDLDLPWDNLVNKTILVSGASGMLPAYLVESLLYMNDKNQLNVKIIGLVRNKEKAIKRFEAYQKRKDLQLILQDVSKTFTLDEKIDLIIHAASQASPKYYRVDPVGTISANILGTYNLLELSKSHQVENFLFFSSGEVYGEITKEDIPTKETMYAYFDHCNFRACYGQSKKMGETMCIAYAHQYGIPVKIVRPYHVYGPGMQLNDGRLFSDLVDDIIKNRDIVLWSNGTAVRSFCYIADATAGFFSVLLKGESSEAYNIGNPKSTLSVLQLAQRLIDLFPEKNLKIIKKIRPHNSDYVPSNIEISCPDISKAMCLGWRPKISIEKGFEKTVRSFNEYS